MKTLIVALAIGGMAAVPGFAQDMSCAEFTAMDSAAQMEAMAAMAETMQGGGEMAPGGNAMAPAAGDAAADAAPEMSQEDMMTEAVGACAANPDMTVAAAMEAMAN